MKYQDIQISDVLLRSQFIQYWLNGNYNAAFSIIANNPQLDSKAFISDCLNLVAQGIIMIENYYSANVTQYFIQELTQYNTAINNFRNIGTYSPTIAYKIGNFVVYDDDIYICIQNSTGNLPTNTAYFVYIGLRGEQGADGINVTLKYNWDNLTNYLVNDVVVFDNIMYYAKQPNTNKIPSLTSEYWGVFLEVPKAKIVISSIPPTQDMLYDGLIWWQIL